MRVWAPAAPTGNHGEARPFTFRLNVRPDPVCLGVLRSWWDTGIIWSWWWLGGRIGFCWGCGCYLIFILSYLTLFFFLAYSSNPLSHSVSLQKSVSSEKASWLAVRRRATSGHFHSSVGIDSRTAILCASYIGHSSRCSAVSSAPHLQWFSLLRPREASFLRKLPCPVMI